MCPDVHWEVKDESGDHIIVKSTSNSRPRQRKIALSIVVLLGISLGVIYSSIAEPTHKPTSTNVPTTRSTSMGRPTLEPTSLSRPARPHSPVVMPTLALSAASRAAMLYPVPTTNSALPSCLPATTSAWRYWRSDPFPYAVRALLLDQGQLWAGTVSGLFNIDPRTDLYTRTLPYETTGGISLLLPLEAGRLWLEANQGHFYYDGYHWFQIQITGDREDYRTVTALIDQHGDLLLQHMTGNSRTSNQYHFLGHAPPRDQPWMVALESPDWGDSTACPWQAFTNGVSSYRSIAECQTKLQAVIAAGSNPSIMPGLQRGISSALDTTGNVWWIDSRASSTTLSHVVDGRLVTFTLSIDQDVSGQPFFFPIAPDPDHGIWYGDRQGLVYTDGAHQRRIDFAYEPCTVFGPNDLAIDSNGVMWLGTADGRILQQASTETSWLSVPLPQLTQNELKRSILAIAVDPMGSLWATHGYDLFNVGSPRPVKSALPAADCPIDHLVATTESVWARGYCGVWQFDPARQTWTRHQLDRGALIVVASNETVYAASQNGLYRYQDAMWRQVAVADATVMTADQHGGLWLASRLQGELWHYQDGRLTAFGQRFNPNGLVGLIVDNQNQLWAAYPDVLVRCEGENWQYIQSPLKDIRRITADPAGRIWVTGQRSTSQLSDAALAVYAPAP